jgi:hypothetical protein
VEENERDEDDSHYYDEEDDDEENEDDEDSDETDSDELFITKSIMKRLKKHYISEEDLDESLRNLLVKVADDVSQIK